MENIFKELEKFGLSDFSDIELYEKREVKMVSNNPKKTENKTEKDFIFNKSFHCPVCSNNFTSKVLKSKTAKFISQDLDCKPNYNIEVLKYNVAMCPHCGYANMINDFQNISTKQIELFKENIKYPIEYSYNNNICSYEEALTKFKMALVTAKITK